MIDKGTKAPDFTLPDSDGQPVSLSQFAGQMNVVLYFYPKDDTPGCTVEAKGFSSERTNYDRLETVVIGVSKDSVASHQKFCRRYGLQVRLLSDPDQKVISQYGLGRITYLIDKQGIVRKVWPKVTPAGHEQQVLAALEELRG